MALLFVDGFDHYNSSNVLKKWTSSVGTSVSTINATAGRRGGGCLHLRPAYQAESIQKAFANTVSPIVGVGVYLTVLPATGEQPLITFKDTTTEQLTLTVNSIGVILVRRGNYTGTLLAQTPPAMLNAAAWHYIEFKATINDTTGVLGVQLNGVVVLNLTAQDTKASANASINVVELHGDGSNFGFQAYYDDFYLCDNTGTTNNNFLGDCRVDTLFPSAEGTYQAFTPSTGTAHWSTLDEPILNDTDYVSANVVGNKDSYGFTNLPGVGGTIMGVQINNAAQKTDAGLRSTANLVRSGTTDELSTAIALTTSQLIYSSIHEKDPATAAGWTESGVNAAEFGMEVAV